MKKANTFLKIAAALCAMATAVFVVMLYLDKLLELYNRRLELTQQAKVRLQEKTQCLKEKLPTKERILGKLPTKAELIRRNPFRKAEIEAEFADYADVE